MSENDENRIFQTLTLTGATYAGSLDPTYYADG